MKKAVFIVFFIFLSFSGLCQRIAILGAMPEEVQLLEKELIRPKTKMIMGLPFKTGTLNGQKVVIGETGVGKVNAAMTTALIINQFHPKVIIFTGIAGAVNSELNQGDILIGNQLTYHDYGRLTNDGLSTNPTRNPHTKKNNPLYFKADSNMVLLAKKASESIDLQKLTVNSPKPKIIIGTIVTGDTFVASSKAVQSFREKYMADATEMEGAAVAQICHQENIPFLIIRSISDKANEAAQVDFQTFKKIASDNSAILVKAILGKL
jgi:adenosylhomocysteine nucleosidase